MPLTPEPAVAFVDVAGAAVPTSQAVGRAGLELDAVIDRIIANDRALATLAADRAALIESARQLSIAGQMKAEAQPVGNSSPGGWNAEIIAQRELATELACALRIPERTAQSLIANSATLVTQLPATFAALRSGEFSYRHATTIVDHADSLPVEARAAFEAAVLRDAKKLTVAKLDRKARVVRERMHPESIEVRKSAGFADRGVWIQPANDGMAWLNAYLPAEQAFGIDDRLAQFSDLLGSRDESRTRAQLRADAFADLLIDGEIPGSSVSTSDARSTDPSSDELVSSGIRARVLVTVPVLTLLGRSDEPATLEGYGPIDADTARKLAGNAPSFTRLLTHPETGAVLSVGRDRYVVPKDLRTWLRVRDETCRFPGCSKRAGRCEIDHTIDWQHDGTTRHDNLAHLCPGHHHLKHQTRWSLRHRGDGELTWTSPLGREYTTAPAVTLK